MSMVDESKKKNVEASTDRRFEAYNIETRTQAPE